MESEKKAVKNLGPYKLRVVLSVLTLLYSLDMEAHLKLNIWIVAAMWQQHKPAVFLSACNGLWMFILEQMQPTYGKKNMKHLTGGL